MNKNSVRIPVRTVGFGLLALAAACQPAQPGDEPAQAAPAMLTAPATPSDRAAAAGSFASAVDERGVPSFLYATTRQPAPEAATAEKAARFHLARHAQSLGLGREAQATAEVVHTQDLGPGGVLARVRQRVGGLEVYRSEIRVLMRRDLELVALSGAISPTAKAHHADARRFRIGADAALAGALSHLFNVAVTPSEIVDLRAADGEYARLQLAAGSALAMPEPARVKKILFPSEDELIAAWLVELYAGAATDVDTAAYRYVLAADDGRVLDRADLTAHEAFTYRVWAESTGDNRPLDGPLADFTPHPTGVADGSRPTYVAPSLITLEGLNKNPMGRPDPWLPTGGTETSGNNVNAYVDRVAPDGLTAGQDFRASTTSAGTFGHTYDTAAEPTANTQQAMAGVTQLFYTVNWLHDYFYDSGFNEAAGNAQKDNYGRGGLGNDAIKAESQDNVFGGSRNNANMSTPNDGMPPRMQMFVWSGRETAKLTVSGGNVATRGAAFGPASFDKTGTVTLVNDGKGASPTDGCEAFGNVTGLIALIDRGNCPFKQKAVNAQAAGAVGVLIVDNVTATTPPPLGDGAPNVAVTIPVMSMTKAAGTTIKTALGGGPVTATLYRMREVDGDGGLENLVVSHEWGHYFHHRLADCAAKQCSALSEGWGDFIALFMILRDGDNLDGSYSAALYAARAYPDGAYYGIRRFPYTTDFKKNGLTFKHISDGMALPMTPKNVVGGPNSEVHNAGEVWASMLWEAYTALHKAGRMRSPALSFDQVRRRFADYLVAGLQMTPRDATFTEQRDAILAAAAARDKEDLTVLAQAFARRGAGSCAVSPVRNSSNFAGVVESMQVSPRIDIGSITLDDSAKACDSDGVLDAGERGKLVIAVTNGGPAPMIGTRLTLSSTTPGVTFPAGDKFEIPPVAPLASSTVTTEITIDPALARTGTLALKVDAQNGSTCEGGLVRDLVWRVNYDEALGAAARDDVESSKSPWTLSGSLGTQVWSREEAVAPNHAWRGVDYASPSDTALVSPELKVSAKDKLVITFDHRHQFEAADEDTGRVFYDGGVIEISEDGAGWKDISTYVSPGYGGTVTDVSGNPLAKRMAIVDRNKSYPKTDPVTLDLGTALAGKTVKIRFRIGTDEAAGDFGWEIDNIGFQGIDNKPFATLADDAGKCRAAVPNMPGVGGGSGCGCRVDDRSPTTPAVFVLLMVAAAMLVARRRKNRL